MPRATFPALVTRAILAAGGAPEDPADRAWVMAILTQQELALWNEQPEYDRRHAVRVAKRVERRLARTRYGGDTRWLSAALMHDVGKIRSDLSLRERVVATLASKFVGVATARRWARSAAGLKRRIGLYLIHADLGAELITLPSSLLSAENRLRESCTMQLRGDFSSFITLGRGGTESIPDELLPFF